MAEFAGVFNFGDDRKSPGGNVPLVWSDGSTGHFPQEESIGTQVVNKAKSLVTNFPRNYRRMNQALINSMSSDDSMESIPESVQTAVELATVGPEDIIAPAALGIADNLNIPRNVSTLPALLIGSLAGPPSGKLLKKLKKNPAKVRAGNIGLTGGPDAPLDYRKQGEYWRKGQSITDVHHGAGVSAQAKRARAHNDPEAVVRYAQDNFGIKGGNWKENLIDILEVKTNVRRAQKRDLIYRNLGEKVHPQTIDDLLGSSDLNIRNYTKKQLADRREFKKLYPDADFPEELPFGNIKGKDTFPKVKIRDANGKVTETWTPKNIDEWERRFEIVAEKYGVDAKGYRGKVKTDRRLDIFSSDHSDTHTLIKHFEKADDGNPLFTIEKAIKDGSYNKMPVGQAAQLYADAHKFQEQIAAAVLRRRYNYTKTLFRDLKESGQLRGYNTSNFDRLNKAAKQRFFEQYAPEIGRKGGLKKGIVPEDVYQDARQGWTKGMTDVYGWNPTKDIKPSKRSNIQELLRIKQ